MSFQYKRRRRQDDLHVDDWLMTYADLITLLLCFFAVFLSVSVPEKEQFEEAREKVMEKFATQDILANKFPEPSESDNLYDKQESFIDQYNKVEDVEPERAGDRITTMEMDSAAFFAVGSATLSAEGQDILRELVKQFDSPQYIDYAITVEGHTDDSPINTAQFPSNWELSTARAAAVVRFFMEQGVARARLRASGYADVFPKLPNRDDLGRAIPANQAANRRVVIKLEKLEKALAP